MVRYYSFFIYLNMQLSTPCLGSLFLRTHFHFYFEDVSIVHLSYFRLLLFLIFPQTHLLFLFKMSNYYPPYLFQSPLHLAAVSPHGGMCLEILLSEGADVNIRCKDGRMPLHMIALQGRYTRAESLIEHSRLHSEYSETNIINIPGFAHCQLSFSTSFLYLYFFPGPNFIKLLSRKYGLTFFYHAQIELGTSLNNANLRLVICFC